MCKGTEVFKPVPLCIPTGVPLQKLTPFGKREVTNVMGYPQNKASAWYHAFFVPSFIHFFTNHAQAVGASIPFTSSIPASDHSQNLRECELCSQSVWSNLVHLYLEKSKVANLFIYPGTRELQEQRGLWFLRDNSILILYITKELVNQYRNFNKTC